MAPGGRAATSAPKPHAASAASWHLLPENQVLNLPIGQRIVKKPAGSSRTRRPTAGNQLAPRRAAKDRGQCTCLTTQPRSRRLYAIE
ncbi:MAG: hypothetical protein A2W31_10290 [Planctomycetes bacterium RBG_16_64_10]|nr:MAG: hypothetical protein A2W31_10290 [Planctomycetes bacterium RBG_16_64_10]